MYLAKDVQAVLYCLIEESKILYENPDVHLSLSFLRKYRCGNLLGDLRICESLGSQTCLGQ